MITLGIDSSTDILAIGLADSNIILGEMKSEALRDHASRIMPMIDNLLTECGLDKNQLEGLVISIGPGSFTGLRIGMAVAKGAALSRNLPLLGISTFELVCQRVQKRYDRFGLVSVSRRGEFYIYQSDSDSFEKEKMSLVSDSGLIKISADLTLGVIGRKPENWDQIAPLKIDEELLTVSGGEIALLGSGRLAQGERDDPATLEPWYLALSQAEINFGRQ